VAKCPPAHLAFSDSLVPIHARTEIGFGIIEMEGENSLRPTSDSTSWMAYRAMSVGACGLLNRYLLFFTQI